MLEVAVVRYIQRIDLAKLFGIRGHLAYNTKMNESPGPIRVDFNPFAGPELEFFFASTEAQREVFAASDWGADASCAFNESWSVRLVGGVDLGAFAKAAQALVDRHEALRSVLTPDGTNVCVCRTLPCGLEVKISGLAEYLRREVETPFDLVKGPLFRMALFTLGPGEHVFVFTAHHVICDGWSAAVLVKDLGAFYDAFSHNLPANLGQAARFSDYAADELAHQDSDERSTDETYWRRQFQRGAPVLDLPLDAPRPPQKTYRSRRQDLVIPTALVGELKRLGAKQKASYFTVLLAGFYAWLGRVSGQDQLVVGVPAAGQAAVGGKALVGHCVNLLPMPCDVDPSASFTGFLSIVRAKVLDAFDHQKFTYGSLLKHLVIDRDPSRSPLVSVMFNVDQGLSEEQLGFQDLTPRFQTTPRSFENFELFLNVIEINGVTTIECQFNADLFHERTIKDRLESYLCLLTSVTRAPEAALRALPMLTPDERQRVVVEYNLARPLTQSAASLPELFEAQVKRSPQKGAVAGAGQSLTYAELNARANQVAHRLVGEGVNPGELVGIALARTPDLLAGLLGIMKAGAAYVPIDPSYPADRLLAMFDDAALRFVLTSESVKKQLPSHSAKALYVGDAATAKLPREAPPNLPPDNARTAYVIFTSGSTGRPKGVAVPQSAVVNFLESMAVAPGLAPNDVLLAVTTISFDIHVLELYLPLITGAKVLLATRDQSVDGMELKELLETNAVTVLQATPSTWRLLFDAGWAGKKTLKGLAGGEALPRDLAERLVDRLGELWNMYGPTETTVWSTCWRVKDPKGKILIGKPIANTTCYVVDGHLEPVPTGVTGELLIGGAGVAKGYLGRDELTAEKFLADPFDQRPGARVYRTGDFARWNGDGQLECLGRTDHQVKLRGFRLELGEIEASLLKQPGITAAFASIRERAPGDPRLVAWYVGTGSPVDESALKSGLRGILPEYMIPQVFKAIAAIPLTPNGKVDRSRLPSPFDGDASAGAQTRPRRPLTVRRKSRNGRAQAVSPMQLNVLRHEARRPGSALYNLPTAFRLSGRLDLSAMTRAVKEFAERHDSLLTGFDPVTSEQFVERSRSATLGEIDWRHVPSTERQAKLIAEFNTLCERPFDLTRPPLFKVVLYRLADDDNVLFMLAHHSIWDGWSFDLFLKELAALYQAFSAKQPSPLSPLPLQYADYSSWLNDEIAAGSLLPALDYWRAKLADLPRPLPLATDRPRPATMSGKGRSTSYSMPRDLANALTAVGKESGATLFMVLLAAFKVLLFRRTGRPDQLIATPVRGRNEPETEGLIGCFVNLVVLRTTVHGQATFAQFLRQVRQTALEGTSHDELPFETLLEELKVERHPSYPPLVQAIFSFQDARQRNVKFGDLAFTQINVEPGACPVELNFWVKESHESLTGSLNYATDLFDESTILDFLRSYDAVLHSIIRNSMTIVDALPVDFASPELIAVRAWFDNLGCLESAILRHPRVESAAATVLHGHGDAPRLIAYFVVKPWQVLTSTDLRRFLRGELEASLVPGLVLEVDAFVVLPSGKVDKQKLPHAAQAGPEGGERDFAPPATEAERLLATIWRELLGISAIDRKHNFFELGGHSLLAIQMIARVERQTGIKLSRMVVTLNTLAQIAQTMNLDQEAKT